MSKHTISDFMLRLRRFYDACDRETCPLPDVVACDYIVTLLPIFNAKPDILKGYRIRERKNYTGEVEYFIEKKCLFFWVAYREYWHLSSLVLGLLAIINTRLHRKENDTIYE